MTTLDRTTYEAARSGLRPIGLAGRALRLFFRAMRMRSDRAAMQAMPDHLLKDMGIARSEIDHYTSMRYAESDTGRMDIANAR